MKYDELIGKLRNCDDYRCDDCELRREELCNPILMEKAADAIEELLGVIQRQKEMINATAYLPLYPKPMKWIPVTERLPENDHTVLVWSHRNSKEYFNIYDHGKWVIMETEDITHWMPLPEPPESVSNPDEMEEER